MTTQLRPSAEFDPIAAFVLNGGASIPDSALRQAAILLLDTIGVAAGASSLEAGRIARATACEIYGAGSDGWSAPILFDGRRASLAGAAYAGATQIDNLDAHDGYNPTRGHIGCAVVPALFAFAEKAPGLSGPQALSALAVAYEVAARAGMTLHATVSDYHTSGAWNALGVVALGCRLLGADAETLRQAFGIAEYHGPRSQMMREIDNPTMLHDGSGMGALVGVSAVLLALRGFKGAPAVTVEGIEAEKFWSDLGADWTIGKNYIKPYPVCRWGHGAVDAARRLRLRHGFSHQDIRAVRIGTFHHAARLFAGMPGTTSQAQYSLAFAVATMLVHGRIGPEHVAGDALDNPGIGALVARTAVVEDVRHSRRFPDGRWSDVTIELIDGRRLESGDTDARGGPEAPMDLAEIREKFDIMCAPAIGAARAAEIWETGMRLIEDEMPFSALSRLVTSPAGNPE